LSAELRLLELEHAGSDSPAYANGECAICPVATLDDGHLTPDVAAGAIEDLVRVAVLLSREAVVRMRDALV
jgi:hypothetical protein